MALFLFGFFLHQKFFCQIDSSNPNNSFSNFRDFQKYLCYVGTLSIYAIHLENRKAIRIAYIPFVFRMLRNVSPMDFRISITHIALGLFIFSYSYSAFKHHTFTCPVHLAKRSKDERMSASGTSIQSGHKWIIFN